MKLQDYLKINSIKLTDFAKKLGVTMPHLSGVANGRIVCSKKLASKIQSKSDGAVSIEEAIDPKGTPSIFENDMLRTTVSLIETAKKKGA